MTKTHDLTNGWTLTEFDNGAVAISCHDPKVGGVALDPEQAAKLREIIRSTDDEGRPTKITLSMLAGMDG